jgi:integrase
MARIRRQETKSGVVYRVEVRLKGYPEQRATFDRKGEAVTWAEDVEHALRNNLPLPGEELPLDDKRIDDAVDAYLLLQRANKNRRANTKITDEGTALRIIKAFGDKSLRTLTREDIEKHRDDRLSTVGSSSVRQDLSMLSKLYETARIQWRMTGLDYPGRDVARPAPPAERKKVVKGHSFARLFEECEKSKNQTLAPLIRLMINTGMRPSEACLLRWGQVDLKEGIIDLTKTKTDPRMVPLSADARQALASVAPADGNPHALLFITEEIAAKDKPPRFFRRAFEQACIRAGINRPKKRDVSPASAKKIIEDQAPAVTLYTLRHSAATYLLENGTDIRLVAAILGHSNITQTMRYTHPGMKVLQNAVDMPDLPWKTPATDQND